MVIFYVIIVILVLFGIKKRRTEEELPSYLSKDSTNAIKGFFILVVFMRHVVPYVEKAGYEMPNILDKWYGFIDWNIGQLLVVMFLFYSGYGVMTSIGKKGNEYIYDIPKKRVLNTFLNFDIAVALFLVMDFALGIKVETEQYFLARLGWDSVGNSNWYIFIILICYLLTYFCFRMSRKGGAFLLIVMTIAVIAIVYFVKQPHWYNTILSYPAGILYAQYKDRIEKVIRWRYWWTLLTLGFLFFVIHYVNLHLYTLVYAYLYNVECIVFAFLVVTLTMKVKIGNAVLRWLGANLFPLYIYQRMPMIMIRELAGREWLATNPYLFVLISMAGMLLISYFYKYWSLK